MGLARLKRWANHVYFGAQSCSDVLRLQRPHQGKYGLQYSFRYTGVILSRIAMLQVLSQKGIIVQQLQHTCFYFVISKAGLRTT